MSALTLDQREYVAHMAQQRAERQFKVAENACWDAIDDDVAPTPEQMARLREWRGIVKACKRERARCTALKHGTT